MGVEEPKILVISWRARPVKTPAGAETKGNNKRRRSDKTKRTLPLSYCWEIMKLYIPLSTGKKSWVEWKADACQQWGYRLSVAAKPGRRRLVLSRLLLSPLSCDILKIIYLETRIKVIRWYFFVSFWLPQEKAHFGFYLYLINSLSQSASPRLKHWQLGQVSFDWYRRSKMKTLYPIIDLWKHKNEYCRHAWFENSNWN
jgi:hypothetical protein